MKFSEIKQFTSVGNYEVNIPLRYLEKNIKEYEEGYALDLNPDFQRGHVWTREQQTAWLEYFFSGGVTGNVLYFNCPEFIVGRSKEQRAKRNISGMTIVDGLQRLTALRAFLRNEVAIFGHYLDEFEDRDKYLTHKSVRFNVNCLQTREELLTWYIEMNSGGTPHTQEEIERVRNLLNEEVK